MQLLDEQNKSPLQTFDYIRRFAQFVQDKKGAAFRPEIHTLELNSETRMFVVEPPCGSNTYIVEYGNELLFVDCGFACYRNEMENLFLQLFPRYREMKKTAFITHADVDHTGLLSLFDTVYMSQNCYDNFVNERNGVPNFRERNPLHAPYCALSKIISGYHPPDLSRCIPVGCKQDSDVLSYIGSCSFGPWTFDFYEGNGGHVKGETVIVWQEMKVVYSGDIYVNIKGFSCEQREFNRLAPFLMTGVDVDSVEAKNSREYLLKNYPKYLLCPGHGACTKESSLRYLSSEKIIITARSCYDNESA